MNDYREFLTSKQAAVEPSGFEVSASVVNPQLFDWQREIVRWALRLGKAALFAECGLGKTPMQLEWARHVVAHTGRPVLILAPLAVTHQTVSEGKKFGVEVAYCRSQAEAKLYGVPIVVTNYEVLSHFDPAAWAGVVLDESSILKAYSGKTRKAIQAAFAGTPYKLCCTATPAPNDHMEIGNHSEFLDVMRGTEMLARWFINDSMNVGHYRLKGHAEADFWRWVASWAVCVSKPSDLGYPNDGFDLPALQIDNIVVQVDHSRAHAYGRLFLDGAVSATAIWKEKAATSDDRCAKAAETVKAHQNALTENSISAKLAECGNQNTPAIAATKLTVTLPTAPSATRKASGKTLKQTAPTTRLTTERTKPSGANGNKQPETSETGKGENATPMTPSSEKNASGLPTSTQSAIPASDGNKSSALLSASVLPNTKHSSNGKAGVAPSAAPALATDGEGVSSLTTATLQEKSADSFVQPATLDSASSKTVPSSSPALSNTSTAPGDFWVVWCDTNQEQDILERHFGKDAVSIRGSDSTNRKEQEILRWLSGEKKILISKVDIFGFGMNFQHCAQMVFVGVSYSFEKLYQALRRSWRFGQTRPVTAYLVVAESEGNVMDSIRHKQAAHHAMQAHMNAATREYGTISQARRTVAGYDPRVTMRLPVYLTPHTHTELLA